MSRAIYTTMSRAHSRTFPSLHLRHSSFSNPSVALPTSWALHFPTLPSLHLRHSSFSNPSVALPTSQLILQPFRCFTCVTAHSPVLLSLLLRHRLFTYVTWRAAHVGWRKRSARVLVDYTKNVEKVKGIAGIIHISEKIQIDERSLQRKNYKMRWNFSHTTEYQEILF